MMFRSLRHICALVAIVALSVVTVSASGFSFSSSNLVAGPAGSTSVTSDLHRIADEGSEEDAVAAATETAIATFASGCFWCTEADFDKIPGVLKTVSGFTGGTTENPTYKQVVRGGTGHTEALEITYDPTKVTYKELLAHFWKNVDPFDLTGQFCDRGDSYRPAIFAHSAEQKALAEASRAELNASGKFKKKIELPILDAGAFTAAAEYHQNFYKKNPWHYYRYRNGCARDARLAEIWGKEGS
ncbi:MAG: peptide-methionine (S)-S-oxide reductase MsrA [Pseudomonadota bacterium]